ncbi:MAG: hypothetical protein WCO02_11310 [Bacteroidota bacterium]
MDTTMIGKSLRNSIQKRQEAIKAYKSRKEAFLKAKQEITAEIEQAKLLWKNTMAQLPDQDFDQ